MKSRPRSIDPNPIQQASAFAPPPTGVVTIEGMKRETIAYWKTIRLAWLAGYKINWVIPGRGGAVGSSHSVWDLDVRIQPVETIIPARTSRYSLEPYVLVGGRPYIEPVLGTRTTVKFTVTPRTARGASVFVTEAPGDLGETARWLPTPESYSGGLWSPSGTAPAAPDASVHWQGSEQNLPAILDDFTYSKHGEWVNTTAMSLQASNYLRLDGLGLYEPPQPERSVGDPLAPVTMFFVATIVAPTKYWGSLLKATEPDGSSDLSKTNLDFRLMPDGNLHSYTLGWQAALPLVSDNHSMCLFGFTLDPATNFARIFTVDRSLQIEEFNLPSPHSSTSKFVLGMTAEALFTIYVLDILLYRGPMDTDRIEFISGELDAAYGLTPAFIQEEG